VATLIAPSAASHDQWLDNGGKLILAGPQTAKLGGRNVSANEVEPDPITRVPDLVARIYAIVAELERLFPGRKFTPDGHMVGSIGEVMARYVYDVELLPPSTKEHDARASDGRLVQVKTTQVDRIPLSHEPRHLLVLQLGPDGRVAEVYNGPGARPWSEAGKEQRNGQKPISLVCLKRLQSSVAETERLPRVRAL
jgi:hypothetical protein